MKRATQGAVLLAVGTVLVSFTVSGAFQSYVRTGLRIPLILAGLCLLTIGGIAVIAGPEEVVADDGHGHGHTTMRVGMLLLGFVAAAYLISPAPLGAYAAGRGNENRIPLTPPRTDLSALADRASPPDRSQDAPPPVDETTVVTTITPPTTAEAPGPPSPPSTTAEVVPTEPQPPEETVVIEDPVELYLYDFLTYTLFEPDAIRGLPVRFIGFAADEPEIPGAYRLTRFTMACCAADAYPIQIIITGATPRPANDQWLQVDGIWDGAMFDLDEYTQIPILEAAAQQVIEAPTQPYEY